MATPSNNRHKDVYGGLPRLPRHSIASLPELEKVPPSSISCVPSSSRKAQHSSFLAPDSIGKTDHSAIHISETPTRGPGKLGGRPPTSTVAVGSLPDLSQPSPLSTKLPKIANDLSSSTYWSLHNRETPSKLSISCQDEQSGDTTINATPVKAPFAMGNPPESLTKTVSSPLLQGGEKSIYAALGWDDVDELL